jgi:hypothetical protein
MIPPSKDYVPLTLEQAHSMLTLGAEDIYYYSGFGDPRRVFPMTQGEYKAKLALDNNPNWVLQLYPNRRFYQYVGNK